MANVDLNKVQAPTLTNPLQNNNAAMTAVGYLAGIAAAKLPIFDFATWNYIFMTFGGMIVTVGPYILNRKSAVITTVANLAEVKSEGGIVLDKTVPGATALAAVTPDNVVAK